MASQPTTQTSIWYFVGATFIFGAPALYFPGDEYFWLRLATIVLGFVVVAAGIVVFIREQGARRDSAQGEGRPPVEGSPRAEERPE